MVDTEVIREAFSNLIAGLVNFVPSLITGLIILFIGWLISRFVSTLVKRLAERIGLEKILDRAGLGDGLKRAGLKQSPAGLAATLVYWIIFPNFLLISLEIIGLQAAIEPLRNLIAFLPSILVALITFVAGAMIAQLIGQAVQGAMAGMGIEFHEALGNIVRMLLMVVLVIIVVQQLGLDTSLLNTTFINLLTLAVAGLALAFGLGGKDVARNVLAGHYAREMFSMGDQLVIDGEVGTLSAIGTLNAEIDLGDDRLVIPNKQLTETAMRVREM